MENPFLESILLTDEAEFDQSEIIKKSNIPKTQPSSETDINHMIEGPNVNLKIPKKKTYTNLEKENFKSKISKIKKTELCKNWELYGNCFYKDSCSFAHGERELRRKSNSFNIKYKTKKCVMFMDNMYCPFGNRCQYSHILPHSKLLSFNYKLQFFAVTLLKEISKSEEDLDLVSLIANRKYQK